MTTIVRWVLLNPSLPGVPRAELSCRREVSPPDPEEVSPSAGGAEGVRRKRTKNTRRLSENSLVAW